MSYILHKNETPPFAYKPQLPEHMPSLPRFFEEARDRSVNMERLHLPNIDEKWENHLDNGSMDGNNDVIMSKARRMAFNMLSTNPFVPFSLRGTVFIFSIVGLGLAARIFVLTKLQGRDEYHQQPSVIMALVVLSVALVYLTYSTYNEFFGQPLGLRSATSKMLFIMVDLVFIIFASSNLSLAFNTLFDRSWICQAEDSAPSVCSRQRDLVGVLFVSLCFWLATFGVSLFRMIDRAAAN